MAHIHPTAVISGDVQLADDVVVGPYCVLAGRVRVGPSCTLVSHVHLHGPLWMGKANICYPGVCLGFAPQDLKFDSSKDGAGLVIGDGNTFREHCTIHRATKEDRPTTVGNRNYWMANSHAGHDVQVGSDCILANGTLLAGHVQVGDRVVFGGACVVHQFVRIGRGCMISGLVGTGGDLCPFFTLTGINVAGSLNLVGMRRAGMSRDDIDAARWCYRIICRSGLMPKQAIERLRERENLPMVREYIDFLSSAKRYVATRRGRRVGGTVGSSADDSSDA
ncbi:MAG: acyl-ACP--UDP-N-acetylglucosamine O-acyltransferase [Phycisphaerales bacterium]